MYINPHTIAFDGRVSKKHACLVDRAVRVEPSAHFTRPTVALPQTEWFSPLDLLPAFPTYAKINGEGRSNHRVYVLHGIFTDLRTGKPVPHDKITCWAFCGGIDARA